MGNFAFWQRWLVAVSVLVTAGGLGITLLAGTSIFDTVFDNQINPVFWDTKTTTPETEDFQKWVYGILGATMTGWGIMLAFMAYYPFKTREKWAWTGITAGLVVWFIIDSTVSLLLGVTFNALAVNLPIFFLALVPLLATYPDFFGRRT